MKFFQVALPLFLTAAAAHAEWPQYRGPQLDGTTREVVSLPWAESGPKTLWKAPTPAGFSSITIAGGKAFTLISEKVLGTARETCVAFDASTGKRIWGTPLAVAKYDGGGNDGTRDNRDGDGPRSTPSVADGRIFVLDGRFVLTCLDAADGKLIWSKDLINDFKGESIRWQNAASPLLDGGLVFVAGGGADQSLLALDQKTGAVKWKTGTEVATHATPVVANILGQRQVIFFTKSGLVSVAHGTGAELWRHKHRFAVSTAASPIVDGDLVFCSAGYGVGASCAQISKSGDGFKATEKWRTPGKLENHWSTPIVKDGHLYGMFQFKEYGSGPVKCVELATGKEKWSKSGFGPGNVILAGNQLVVLSDDGHVVVVDPNPTAYRELARTKAVTGKCWSTPTLSDGRLYVRSTKEAVCLDVTAKSAGR